MTTMKKLMFLVACVIALTACDNKSKTNPMMIQNDSLRAIIEARDNEINDMMGTLNDIQDGFRAISEAEDRVTIAKSGEGANRAAQIKEDIQFIAQRMEENRELIKKLQQQLRETGFKGDQMKKTIDELTTQLAKKDKQLQALREELDKKDIHIAELDEQVADLNTNVTNLTAENTEKAQTISTQDKQLNTAWFVFGTSKELKEHNVLVKGKVLQGDFDKSYFTKIDIRIDKEIKLYSKSATILTTHPASAYTLERDANKQYILRITDPQLFWSTSKYLVVQVK